MRVPLNEVPMLREQDWLQYFVRIAQHAEDEPSNLNVTISINVPIKSRVPNESHILLVLTLSLVSQRRLILQFHKFNVGEEGIIQLFRNNVPVRCAFGCVQVVKCSKSSYSILLANHTYFEYLIIVEKNQNKKKKRKKHQTEESGNNL